MFRRVLAINFIVFASLISLFATIGVGWDFLTRKSANNPKIARHVDSKYKHISDALAGEGLQKDFSISYYPDFASNFFGLSQDIFPINGVSNIKTYYCNEQGFLSSYIADRHGFNNDDHILSSGSLDIVLIGDSYMHGACTNEQSVQQNLRRIFPDLKIASFAQGGAGPLLQLAYIKEYAKYYNPKLVFWVWTGNDLRNLQDELQSPLRRYMVQEFIQGLNDPETKKVADSIVSRYILNISQQAKDDSGSGTSSNRISALAQHFMPRSYIILRRVYFWTKGILYATSGSCCTKSRSEILARPLTNKEIRHLLKPSSLILTEAKKVIESNGGSLVLVYLGYGGWNSNPFINKKHYSQSNISQYEFLRAYSSSQNIKLYNLDADIDRRFSSRDHINGHFSDKGYEIVGKIFADYVLSEQKAMSRAHR